jgi:hypothetical protein
MQSTEWVWEANHVYAPAKLSGDKNAGRIGDAGGNDDLLDLVTKSLLDGFAQVVVQLGLLLASLLILVGLLELHTILGDTDEFLALELLELGDGVLVDGIDEKEDPKALLLELLKERRVLEGVERLAGEVVNALLDLGQWVMQPLRLACSSVDLVKKKRRSSASLLRF